MKRSVRFRQVHSHFVGVIHKGIPLAQLIGEVRCTVPQAGVFLDKEIVADVRAGFPGDLLGKRDKLLHQPVQGHGGVQPRAVHQKLYPGYVGELGQRKAAVCRRRQLAVGRVHLLVQRKRSDSAGNLCFAVFPHENQLYHVLSVTSPVSGGT